MLWRKPIVKGNRPYGSAADELGGEAHRGLGRTKRERTTVKVENRPRKCPGFWLDKDGGAAGKLYGKLSHLVRHRERAHHSGKALPHLLNW
jgi:hypothetical protein